MKLCYNFVKDKHVLKCEAFDIFGAEFFLLFFFLEDVTNGKVTLFRKLWKLKRFCKNIKKFFRD